MDWSIIVVAGVTALFGGGGLLAIVKFLKDNSKYKELISELAKDVKRLEIQNLINHTPKNKKAIYEAYDKYRDMGGNSYICDCVEDWENQMTKK